VNSLVGRCGAVLAATVLGVPFLAACTPPRKPQPCEWMAKAGEAPGRTAILVDVTNSTRAAGSGRGAPDYTVALKDTISHVVGERHTVSVAPFSGSEPDLRWSADDQSADWSRDDANPGNQEDRRTEAQECLGEAVGRAQAAPPSADGTDVLRPAATAAEWLRQGKGAKHLVIATDGLITNGCASLVKSHFSGTSEIDAIIKACSAESAQELRPAVFEGIVVTLVGIGHPAAGQPVPTPAEVQWLKQLWERLCEYQGGTCDVRTSSVGSAPDRVGPASVDQVPDPRIDYRSKKVVYSLPEAVLFETGDSRLRVDAEPVLMELAVALRTGAVVTAEVLGFADPRGDENMNKSLSRDRAQVVAAFLRSRSVTNVKAEGRGETTRCVDGTTFPATATSDEQTACARRVDVVATRA
jgi:OOP family OmpA-OmpF porin